MRLFTLWLRLSSLLFGAKQTRPPARAGWDKDNSMITMITSIETPSDLASDALTLDCEVQRVLRG